MSITVLSDQTEIRQELQGYFAERREFKLAALVERMVVEPRHCAALKHNLLIIGIIPRAALFELDNSPAYWETRSRLEEELRTAFESLLDLDDPLDLVRIVDIAQEDVADPSKAGLNNCFFMTEKTIEHDELRFRSKPEISIYDELCKRNVLFFPNAAAVLGGRKKEKREPDFLICDKGKWGILEVMGDGYHKNAAKDHDRARLFKVAGVLCIEFFSADVFCLSRNWNLPSWELAAILLRRTFHGSPASSLYP